MLTELQENLMASMALSGTDVNILKAAKAAIEGGVTGKCQETPRGICPYDSCHRNRIRNLQACALCSSVERYLSLSERWDNGYTRTEELIVKLCSL